MNVQHERWGAHLQLGLIIAPALTSQLTANMKGHASLSHDMLLQLHSVVICSCSLRTPAYVPQAVHASVLANDNAVDCQTP
jgi:hypothetical protein